MSAWQPAAIHPDASLRDAIAKLNERGGQIVLVVREERLLGTITDGDIRRAILAGHSLDAPVVLAMNKSPKTTAPGRSRADLVHELRRLAIHHLPVVDHEGRLVALEADEDSVRPKAEWRPNSVLIMAGGRGTRLAPLTERTPKPMLEVGSRPLLETIIETLKVHRFNKIILAVHHLADVVQNHFGDGSHLDVEIRYLHEPEPRGTAGALSMLKKDLSAPVVVMNGDLLTNLNFDRMFEYHCQRHAAVTMAVREYSNQVPFGVVELDDHEVRALEEKPLQRFIVNAGIYVVEPRVIPSEEVGYLDMTTFLSNLLAENAGKNGSRERVIAFPIHEYWRDIGRIEDLALASDEYAQVFE